MFKIWQHFAHLQGKLDDIPFCFLEKLLEGATGHVLRDENDSRLFRVLVHPVLVYLDYVWMLKLS